MGLSLEYELNLWNWSVNYKDEDTRVWRFVVCTRSPHSSLCHTAQPRLRLAWRRSSTECFAFFVSEFHCHWLFFLLGNEAKPGGLINPSQCWAAVIGSRRKPFSSCAPKGAWREPMKRWNTAFSLLIVQEQIICQQETEKKDATEFRVIIINNIQRYTLEKNKAADTLLLRENKTVQCFCRSAEYSVMQ